MLIPQLITSLRTYSRGQAVRDLVAGAVVGIVALPLAIAFAVASGLTPQAGLFTAIIAGFLVSALGGSRVQIGGPTGAFVVIVYGIVQEHGVEGLTVATIMAGVILMVLGFARLGAAIKFIPFPVTTGFTSGIAVVIFSSQIKDLLGLRMGPVPAHFFEKWTAYAESIGSLNPAAVLVAATSLAIILLWPKVSRRVPATFVALIVTTVGARSMGLDVETIGARFGEITASFPKPTLPSLTLPVALSLVGPAFTIALLGAIESLLSAVVADGMIGGRHRSNIELVAQGVANVTTPLFGGMPATGAIARTATNIDSGGRTPVAGIVHAVTLLLITIFFGRWASLIPFATLAAILVVVAYRMSEWHTFRAELSAPRSDVAVLLTTFVLTITVDLTIAVQVGLVLAAFLFMRRMAEVTNVRMVTREFDDEGLDDAADPNAVRRRSVPDDVQVYEINGPFFFGAAEKFKETIAAMGKRPRVLIVRMRHVLAMDSTGMNALKDLVRRTRHEGSLVVLSDVHAQPLVAVGRSHLLDELGEENIFGNIDDALNRAREHLGLAPVAPPVFARPTVAREADSAPEPTMPVGTGAAGGTGRADG